MLHAAEDELVRDGEARRGRVSACNTLACGSVEGKHGVQRIQQCRPTVAGKLHRVLRHLRNRTDSEELELRMSAQTLQKITSVEGCEVRGACEGR